MAGISADATGELLQPDARQRLVVRRFDEHWSRKDADVVVSRVLEGTPDPMLVRTARGADAVAEVGCGTAVMLFQLARAARRRLAVGYDYAPNAVKLGRAAEKVLRAGVRVELADAHRLPAADETFDLVYSYGVMEHFPDPMPVMREQVRTLKSGGTLLVNVPYAWSTYAAWKASLVRAGRWKFGWETSFTVRGLHRLFAEAGLTVEETRLSETYLVARAANSIRYHARRLGPAAGAVRRAVTLAERALPVPRTRLLTVVGRKP